MVTDLINFLANTVVWVIGITGYYGVFFLMLIESCGIPMPSEVIMPFSGFLVVSGKLGFWQIVILGTLGNLAGSILAYYIGKKGGRPFFEKYGRYMLIHGKDLDLADRWFKKYGELTVFFGRLLPVVRTYISFPAGIAGMGLKKFSFYTAAGALPWSFLFAYLGVKMGNNWDLIREKLHNFDLAMAGLVILLVGLYIWRHLRAKNSSAV